jgi:hypothetical protein
VYRLRAAQNVRVVTDEVGGLDEELRVALNVDTATFGPLFAELIHHEWVSRGRDYTLAKAQRLLDEVNALRRR